MIKRNSDSLITKLDEKQYELVTRYVGMLDTIEEALKYVEASFTDFSKTEGESGPFRKQFLVERNV